MDEIERLRANPHLTVLSIDHCGVVFRDADTDVDRECVLPQHGDEVEHCATLQAALESFVRSTNVETLTPEQALARIKQAVDEEDDDLQGTVSAVLDMTAVDRIIAALVARDRALFAADDAEHAGEEPEERVYLTSLPVAVTVHPDGRVTAAVDLTEAGADLETETYPDRLEADAARICIAVRERFDACADPFVHVPVSI